MTSVLEEVAAAIERHEFDPALGGIVVGPAGLETVFEGMK